VRVGQLPPTDCDLIRASVSAALDGELSEVERARLDAHLRSCPECRAYAAGAGESTRIVRETPLQALDFPIVLPSRRAAVARRLQVASAAAAVVAIVGLSAVVGNVGSGGRGSANATPTQAGTLRSTEQELRLLYRASSALDRPTSRAPWAL